MPDSIYVKCVNCGKQTLTESDEPYNVKCEFCRKPARIKVKEVSKVQDHEVIKANIEKPVGAPVTPKEPGAISGLLKEPVVSLDPFAGTNQATEASGNPELYVGKPRPPRGKRKWAKRCGACPSHHYVGSEIHCSVKRCPQRCPLELRPPFLIKLEQAAEEALAKSRESELTPRKQVHRATFFEKHREEITQDYKILRIREIIEKWHMDKSTLYKLLKKWEVPRKQKKTSFNKPEVLGGGSAQDGVYVGPASVLPDFNETWDKEVKIEWLRARVKLEEIHTNLKLKQMSLTARLDRLESTFSNFGEDLLKLLDTTKELRKGGVKKHRVLDWFNQLFKGA